MPLAAGSPRSGALGVRRACPRAARREGTRDQRERPADCSGVGDQQVTTVPRIGGSFSCARRHVAWPAVIARLRLRRRQNRSGGAITESQARALPSRQRHLGSPEQRRLTHGPKSLEAPARRRGSGRRAGIAAPTARARRPDPARPAGRATRSRSPALDATPLAVRHADHPAAHLAAVSTAARRLMRPSRPRSIPGCAPALPLETIAIRRSHVSSMAM